MRDDFNTPTLEPAFTDASSRPDERPVVEQTFVTNAPDDIRGYKPLEELDEGTANTKRIVGAAAMVVFIGALGAMVYISGIWSPPATQSTQVASNQVPPPVIPTTPPPAATPPVTPGATPDMTAPAQAATAPAAPPVRTARTRAARLREQTVQPTDTDQAASPHAIVPPPNTMTVPQSTPSAPDVTQTPPPVQAPPQQSTQPPPDQPAQTPPPQ